MYRFIAFLLLLLTSPVCAATAEVPAQISKLEFEGIYFGDFPPQDVICVRGLCPLGDMGVEINDNPRILPVYCKEKDITHFNGVRISSPEYSFFDNQMFQVLFDIQCEGSSQQTCLDQVQRGLEARYGLKQLEETALGDNNHETGSATLFVTDSGSLVAIFAFDSNKTNRHPAVKIYDQALMDQVRKSVNPRYQPDTEFLAKLNLWRQTHEWK